ncbi:MULTISPECIES: hypothetical protein [Anaerolinea]|jgi:hypothetical protein|uniref:hypothetical protein n=1 Tax=Anaerolinea TaxID=233189 RepID=UPI002602FA1D|nr:hypothetical protein [Anaerolinea thermophila]
MTLTLSDLLNRVRLFLHDSEGARYSQDDLTAAVRMALMEINLVSAQAFTLAGLDGVIETTLPERLHHLLGMGAAGYAATARAAAQAEWELSPQKELSLTLWSRNVMEDFRRILCTLYPPETARLHEQRAATPFVRWDGDLGESHPHDFA